MSNGFSAKRTAEWWFDRGIITRQTAHELVSTLLSGGDHDKEREPCSLCGYYECTNIIMGWDPLRLWGKDLPHGQKAGCQSLEEVECLYFSHSWDRQCLVDKEMSSPLWALFLEPAPSGIWVCQGQVLVAEVGLSDCGSVAFKLFWALSPIRNALYITVIYITRRQGGA